MENALLSLTPTFAAFGDIVRVLLYIVFFTSSLLLIVIVLLQEGKGGGLAAFGGAGTEAFGVKSGGINKLTATLATVFVMSALVLGWMNKSNASVADTLPSKPAIETNPGAGAVPPAGAPGGAPGGAQPPAGGSGGN